MIFAPPVVSMTSSRAFTRAARPAVTASRSCVLNNPSRLPTVTKVDRVSKRGAPLAVSGTSGGATAVASLFHARDARDLACEVRT
jgi:hypothetical protein